MNQNDISASEATLEAHAVARRGLWAKIRRHAVLVVSLLVWIGGFFTLDSFISRFPLEQAITLYPPGAIDTRIWIPLRERYFLQLEFSRQGHSFEQLKRLIGDWFPQTDGVPVAISWSLTSIKSKVVVAEGATVAKGASGWGPDVYRDVDPIRVEPGRYRFQARILNPVPQLSSIPTRLALTNNFKTTDTWQSSALFFGALFTAWVIIPLAAISLTWLVARIGLHCLRLQIAGSDTAGN